VGYAESCSLDFDTWRYSIGARSPAFAHERLLLRSGAKQSPSLWGIALAQIARLAMTPGMEFNIVELETSIQHPTSNIKEETVFKNGN
jgi:hypothetical protein